MISYETTHLQQINVMQNIGVKYQDSCRLSCPIHGKRVIRDLQKSIVISKKTIDALVSCRNQSWISSHQYYTVNHFPAILLHSMEIIFHYLLKIRLPSHFLVLRQKDPGRCATTESYNKQISEIMNHIAGKTFDTRTSHQLPLCVSCRN